MVSVDAILSLDLGTSCGYAYDYAGQILSGVWDLRPQRFEGGGMRFVRFVQYLDQLHGAKPIGRVYFEEVRAHTGTNAAHIYGGLMGTLTMWCERAGVPYAGVPVQTIKKFIAGRGNASKEDVIIAIEDLGYRPKNDDEADAIALALYNRAGD